MDKYWLQQYQRGIPDEINPDDYTSIPDFLADIFVKHADKVAFSNMGQEITYAEIDVLSQNLSAYKHKV